VFKTVTAFGSQS